MIADKDSDSDTVPTRALKGGGVRDHVTYQEWSEYVSTTTTFSRLFLHLFDLQCVLKVSRMFHFPTFSKLVPTSKCILGGCCFGSRTVA